jgi:hypothetical protein
MVNSGKILPNVERVLLVPEKFFRLLLHRQQHWWVVCPSLASHTHTTKMTFLLHKRFHLKVPVIVVGLLELVKRY